jgi:hypothetical protein
VPFSRTRLGMLGVPLTNKLRGLNEELEVRAVCE